MLQTRKGQQWHFRMKLRIGVDSQTELERIVNRVKAETRSRVVHMFVW